MKGAIIYLHAGELTNWRWTIGLKTSVIREIESIAGPTQDERFLPSSEDIILIEDKETWAWFAEWSGSRIIGLWFRDPSHAMYFKLKWADLLAQTT